MMVVTTKAVVHGTATRSTATATTTDFTALPLPQYTTLLCHTTRPLPLPLLPLLPLLLPPRLPATATAAATATRQAACPSRAACGSGGAARRAGRARRDGLRPEPFVQGGRRPPGRWPTDHGRVRGGSRRAAPGLLSPLFRGQPLFALGFGFESKSTPLC